MLKKVLVGVLACNLFIGCTQQTDVSTNVLIEEVDNATTEDEEELSVIPKTVILNNEGRYIKSKTKNPHYNKNNISEVSNIGSSRLYDMLKSTNLAELTDSFIAAEEKYKINALALVSILALESSWGKSRRAINDNNLSGYAIYSRGSSYSFNSKEDCVMETARLLSEDYLNPNGKYYSGKSLQAINKKYCTSGDWHIKVDSIIRELLRR
ncbi:MAG: glucosaminidase domain-containing protein [Clostridium sp.]